MKNISAQVATLKSAERSLIVAKHHLKLAKRAKMKQK